MKTVLLLVFLCLFCFQPLIKAQNLIQNSSFELVEKMPSERYNIVNCAKYWHTPTFGAPDYYHADAESAVSVPKNRFGTQTAHSGKAYAGICITEKYVEYLGTTLSDTLIKGQNYLIEFYISRADKSKNTLKEFGVLFSDRKKWSINMEGIAEKPSVDFINKDGFDNKKDWIKLSAVYQAEGFESTLILGYFNYDKPEGYKGSCHYYIDDVTLSPLKEETKSSTKTEITDSTNVEKIKMPDTFSPKLNETIILNNIFFETNKSELLPASFVELNKLALHLKENTNTFIKIAGHTDNTGNENQNKSLSELRAKAVADYLILKSVDKSRINYIGYGSSKPVTTNETEEGRRKNRRVEFLLSKNQD